MQNAKQINMASKITSLPGVIYHPSSKIDVLCFTSSYKVVMITFSSKRLRLNFFYSFIVCALSNLLYNSTPPQLYGMVKTHKLGNPIRPVVSFINSPTYETAKFLTNILNNRKILDLDQRKEMDRRERYVAALLRALIKKGVITFVGALSGAIAVGPYGYVLGPAVAATHDYFSRTTEEEQIAEWPELSKSELIKIAITFAVKLAIQNISIIIKICKDIIRLLKRLFNVGEESVDNARMLLHYVPSS